MSGDNKWVKLSFLLLGVVMREGGVLISDVVMTISGRMKFMNA